MAFPKKGSKGYRAMIARREETRKRNQNKKEAASLKRLQRLAPVSHKKKAKLKRRIDTSQLNRVPSAQQDPHQLSQIPHLHARKVQPHSTEGRTKLATVRFLVTQASALLDDISS